MNENLDEISVEEMDALILDMGKVIEVNRKVYALSKLLPRGWSVVISQKMKEKGHDMKYNDFINTIKNPRKADLYGVREALIEYAFEVKKKNDELRVRLSQIA